MITLKENIDFLRNYNNWRRCNDNSIEQPTPLSIGLHIDYAIERLQSLYNDEWDEARIDVISQNGNEALHYDKI